MILSVSTVYGSEEPCSQIDVTTISSHVLLPPDVKLRFIAKYPLGDDLCELVCKAQNQYLTFYVPADGNYVVRGWLFQDKHNLTGARISAIQKAAFMSVQPELDDVTAFKYIPQDKARRVVYFITDPLCTYCHKAEQKIKDLADRYHAEIRFILHSVHGVKGDNKIAEAICRDFTLDDYLKDGWKKKDAFKHDCKKGKKLLRQTREVIGKLGISGVPVFFLEDGAMVSGANLDALQNVLKQKSPARKK